ncbi:hypothetical protein B4145_3294 [Bacillus subtilis]|uniref:Uncharacterized protein n=1 Tax=Bacillus subtilis subsp. subtilis TaxID=135461 RepID=A0ABD3ZW18_BACIU|nr:hypothetical protein B4067_3401 [Bacillus subtilis subsp. subtilis]KIN59515.1 hypothetical protein B4145_3294 [Bacillus subtilis]
MTVKINRKRPFYVKTVFLFPFNQLHKSILSSIDRNRRE